MKFITIIYKIIKKVILAIFNFFKSQFNFIKNIVKTQGIKGILLLILNLLISFIGGLIYEKNRSKKSSSRKANSSTERGQIRQPGYTNRERGAINDIPDERRLGSNKEGRQNRNTERGLPNKVRKTPKAGKGFKSHSKRVWYTTDDTKEYQTQRGKDSRRNTDSQRRKE